jgi:short-subunit dehydrogenase
MTLIAVITGASSGIGEATARRIAREPGARLVLVARRAERLQALAAELGGPADATALALDLTDPAAPDRVREHVESEHGELHLLVNNAGARWSGRFGEAGWENVERHMKLNFEAPLRLTEALLPLLRRTAAAGASDASSEGRVAIVNVASTAGRVSRPDSGGYSASKFAIAGWSDALHAEERAHGVHVGTVFPGFIRTEGFPAAELLAKPHTRRLVGQPEQVAEAIWRAGPGGAAEVYVPRGYWLAAAARVLLPRLVRRATGGGAFSTSTGAGE